MNRPLASVTCFLLDMDGTFYLGESLLPGALDFIDTLRQQGKDFIFLTNNSSKHRREYVEKITRLGLPIEEEKIFTSGEATARYLAAHYPGARLFVAGTPSLQEEFSAHGFCVTEEDPQLVVLGFDTSLTYQKLWRLCDLVRDGLPYFATHPDINCPTPQGFMPDIGALMACVKASTGRDADLIVGKPNRIMVEELARKQNLSLNSFAMVGDRLYTDIALGETAGIETVLVLSGETHRQDLSASPFQPSLVFEDLGELARWMREAAKKEDL
jgi:HAD superfamily hydrolase (TIGR01457 family)